MTFTSKVSFLSGVTKGVSNVESCSEKTIVRLERTSQVMRVVKFNETKIILLT